MYICIGIWKGIEQCRDATQQR